MRFVGYVKHRKVVESLDVQPCVDHVLEIAREEAAKLKWSFHVRVLEKDGMRRTLMKATVEPDGTVHSVKRVRWMNWSALPTSVQGSAPMPVEELRFR